MQQLNTGIDVDQAIAASVRCHKLDNSCVDTTDNLSLKREAKFDMIVKAASKLGVNTVTAKELMSDDDVFNLAFVASLFQASSKAVEQDSDSATRDRSQTEEYKKKVCQLMKHLSSHRLTLIVS